MPPLADPPTIPVAYGNCSCMCHKHGGVFHVMPCCYPSADDQRDCPACDYTADEDCCKRTSELATEVWITASKPLTDTDKQLILSVIGKLSSPVEIRISGNTPSAEVCDVVGCLEPAERIMYLNGVRARMCIGHEKMRSAEVSPPPNLVAPIRWRCLNFGPRCEWEGTSPRMLSPVQPCCPKCGCGVELAPLSAFGPTGQHKDGGQ